MKTINLEHILTAFTSGDLEFYKESSILKAMKEACNQAINLCAESAEAGYKYCGKDPDVEPYVLKNSILDVKKQII